MKKWRVSLGFRRERSFIPASSAFVGGVSGRSNSVMGIERIYLLPPFWCEIDSMVGDGLVDVSIL